MALQNLMREPYILLMFIDSSSVLKLGRLSVFRSAAMRCPQEMFYAQCCVLAQYVFVCIWRGLSVLLIRKTGGQDLSAG